MLKHFDYFKSIIKNFEFGHINFKTKVRIKNNVLYEFS